jgi:hypothetical protein
MLVDKSRLESLTPYVLQNQGLFGTRSKILYDSLIRHRHSDNLLHQHTESLYRVGSLDECKVVC